MKLDALREELKRDPPKPAKKPKAWRVRTVIRQRPLSLLRQAMPYVRRQAPATRSRAGVSSRAHVSGVWHPVARRHAPVSHL